MASCQVQDSTVCLYYLNVLQPSYLPEPLRVHTPAGADQLLLDIPNMFALNQREFYTVGLLYQYILLFSCIVQHFGELRFSLAP